MIGLDTNILVRILANDDAKQLAKIKDFFARQPKPTCYFVTNIVLIETFWVLENAYNFNKDNLVEALEIIKTAQNFIFEDIESINKAAQAFGKGNHDFADLLIGFYNKSLGCTKTITFDKIAAKLDEFELL